MVQKTGADWCRPDYCGLVLAGGLKPPVAVWCRLRPVLARGLKPPVAGKVLYEGVPGELEELAHGVQERADEAERHEDVLEAALDAKDHVQEGPAGRRSGSAAKWKPRNWYEERDDAGEDAHEPEGRVEDDPAGRP